MPTPPLILLTAPEGEFYAHVLRGFAEGFEAAGIACLARNPAPPLDRVAEWARQVRPAAVLEINRFLPAGLAWPGDTAHLVWLQDHRFNGEDLTRSLGASHHLYFVVHPASFGIDVPADRAWSVLVPGARLDAPPPSGAPMRRDFSVVGHLPAPLDGIAPVAQMPDGRVLRLAELLCAYPLNTSSDAAFSMRDIHRAVAEACRRIGCLPITDRGTLQSFDEILVRTLERKRIIESVLLTGGSLEIFGPPSWRKWPQFAPYHRGHVDNPRDLDQVFQTTRVNLHNSGLTLHFRLMDCLAVGGFMLVNETPWDDLPGGIHRYMEPGRHYGAYKIGPMRDGPPFDFLTEWLRPQGAPPAERCGDVADVAARFLADAPARERIAAEGRRLVLAEHTWRNRAEQVLRDIGIAPRPGAEIDRADVARAKAALDDLASPLTAGAA